MQPVNAGDAVADVDDAPDVGRLHFGLVALDLLLQNRADFFGAKTHWFHLLRGRWAASCRQLGGLSPPCRNKQASSLCGRCSARSRRVRMLPSIKFVTDAQHKTAEQFGLTRVVKRAFGTPCAFRRSAMSLSVSSSTARPTNLDRHDAPLLVGELRVRPECQAKTPSAACR